MAVTNIYGLYDPRFPDVVMYVGKGEEKRAQYHWRRFLSKGIAGNALLCRWFLQLKADSVEPAWRFIAEDVADWKKAERVWIAAWRIINPMLCNVADGGNWVNLTTEELRRLGHANGLLHGAKGAAVTNARPLEERLEWCRKGGYVGGSKAGRAGGAKGGRIGGPRGGRRVHELHPGLARMNGLRSTHSRWHIARNKIGASCPLCLIAHEVKS